MTGKDLFAAMNHLDDDLVTEAETYTRRVIPIHTVRWIAALAACFCMLVCWAAAVQFDPTEFFYTGGATDNAVTQETAMEEESSTAAMEFTEGAASAEEGTSVEEGMDGGAVQEEGKSTASGVLPTQSPEIWDDAADRYVIFVEALPAVKSAAESLHAAPLNGTFILDEEIQGTIEALATVQLARPARFFVAFDLYQNGEMIDPEKDAYTAEAKRLIDLGYEFRTLNVKCEDGSVRTRVCGLFSEVQLSQFDASKNYGYVFYFPENEDGTPLDWEDQAELCGLPTAGAQEDPLQID